MGRHGLHLSKPVSSDVEPSSSLETVVTKDMTDVNRVEPDRGTRSGKLSRSRSIFNLFHRTHRRSQSEPWFAKIFEPSESDDTQARSPLVKSATPQDQTRTSKTLGRTRSMIGSLRSKITSPGSLRKRSKTLDRNVSRQSTATPRRALDFSRSSSTFWNIPHSSPIEIPSKADIGVPFLNSSFTREAATPRRRSVMSAIRFVASPTRNDCPFDTPSNKRERLFSPMPGTHFSLDVSASPEQSCKRIDTNRPEGAISPTQDRPRATSNTVARSNIEDPFVAGTSCTHSSVDFSPARNNTEQGASRRGKVPLDPERFESLASRKTRNSGCLPESKLYCGSDPLGRMSNVTAQDNAAESSKRLFHKESMRRIAVDDFHESPADKVEAPPEYGATTKAYRASLECHNATRFPDNDTMKECHNVACVSPTVRRDLSPSAARTQHSTPGDMPKQPLLFNVEHDKPFPTHWSGVLKLSSKRISKPAKTSSPPKTPVQNLERSPAFPWNSEPSRKSRSSVECSTDCSAVWGHARSSTETSRISTSFIQDEHGYRPKKTVEKSAEFDLLHATRGPSWGNPRCRLSNNAKEPNFVGELSSDKDDNSECTQQINNSPQPDNTFPTGPSYEDIGLEYDADEYEMEVASSGSEELRRSFVDYMTGSGRLRSARAVHSTSSNSAD